MRRGTTPKITITTEFDWSTWADQIFAIEEE